MSEFRNGGITLRRVLIIFSIGTLSILMVMYVLFQARNIISGPEIILTDSYTPIQHEKVITLTGVTKNIVKLTLNGKEIHTDEHGAFTQMLVLAQGYSIVSLTAKDRFGRMTEVRREYVYISPSAP